MHNTLTPKPVALGPDAVIHLGAQLDITTLAVTAAFWTHDPTPSPQLEHGRILCVHDYSATWPYWERHPAGDEAVCLLSGNVAFVLDNGHQRQTVCLRAGQAAIVPAGTWHRALIHTPSQILFVTPTPVRTQQRPATANDDHESQTLDELRPTTSTGPGAANTLPESRAGV